LIGVVLEGKMKSLRPVSKATTAIVVSIVFIAFSVLLLGIDWALRLSGASSINPVQAKAIVVAGRANLGSAINVPGGSVLTRHEIAHMRYMREEEKLARDVYLDMANHWSIPVFGKIAQAEQRHMDAVLGLLNRYGVPDPAADTAPGQYMDPSLASMYYELMKKGTLSPIDALRVGGLIEEVDIADLEYAVASTNKANIIRVYENIHRGSRNHLRAFAGLLAQYSLIYQPQKLSAAEVQTVLSSPMENGPPQ
jgi:hypothetical protein